MTRELTGGDIGFINWPPGSDELVNYGGLVYAYEWDAPTFGSGFREVALFFEGDHDDFNEMLRHCARIPDSRKLAGESRPFSLTVMLHPGRGNVASSARSLSSRKRDIRFDWRIRIMEQGTLLPPEKRDELTSSIGLPPGTSEVVLEDVPDYELENGVFGIRLSGNVLNLDWGLSYFRGFQSLPLPETITTDLTVEVPSITGFYGYPRLDVFGFDLAGEIYSVGIWAEVGVYIPEDKDTVVLVRTPLGDMEERFPLLNRPYTKFTVGLDYTFGVGEGLYWNVQFNRGFYDEFSYTDEADEVLGVDQSGFLGKLDDYYLTFLEYSFLSDTVTLTMNFLLAVSEYSDFSSNNTWMLSPEVEYVPFDGMSIEVAYLTFNGAASTKMGAFSDSDLVYVLMKAFFWRIFFWKAFSFCSNARIFLQMTYHLQRPVLLNLFLLPFLLSQLPQVQAKVLFFREHQVAVQPF